MKYPPMLHLPMSNINPGDRFLDQACVKILTDQTRDEHDYIYITELCDGLHLSVSKVNGIIHCERRDGRLIESPNQEESIFMKWVANRNFKFTSLLGEGESIHGEWILRAYGTKYAYAEEPYVIFDMMGADRKLIPFEQSLPKLAEFDLGSVPILYGGSAAIPIDMAMKDMLGEYGSLGASGFGENNLAEGVVYRCERKGKVDFQGKFVRLGKQPIYADKLTWNHPK